MDPFLWAVIFVICLTSSFDLLATVDIGGGNLRLSILLLMMLAPLLIYRANLKKKIHVGEGGRWLIAWIILNSIFVPQALSMFRAATYFIWLSALAGFAILLASNCWKDEKFFRSVVKAAYAAYAANAAFGLVQFVGFRFGFDLFVQQSWMGGFARINGFTYEPSYFATYMIAPWAMGLFLLSTGGRIFSRLIDVFCFVLFSLALILSSSRIGYICMTVALLLMAGFHFSILRKSKNRINFILVFAGVIGLATIGFVILLQWGDIFVLLGGTGLGETSSHSVDSRMEGFWRYWDLFKESPFQGYSLGGVAAEMARVEGIAVIDYDTLRQLQGSNVSIEVVLATGIEGAIVFAIFIWKVTGLQLAWRWGRKPRPLTDLDLLVFACCFGVGLEFIALQFNQNILRNYFWVQIALAMGGLACLHGDSVSKRWLRRAKPRLATRPLRDVGVHQS